MKFNPSLLKKFQECNLQYKLAQEHPDVVELQSAAASFGTLVHKCIEMYLQGRSVDDCVDFFKLVWDDPSVMGIAPDYYHNNTSHESYREKGIKAITEYHEEFKWSSREVIGTEIRFCLTPDTKIVTKSGLVDIETIKVGDEVLTHRGRWRKVTEVITNPSYGSLCEIEIKGAKTLRATANHPLYLASYRGERSSARKLLELDFVPAGEVIPWGRVTEKCHSVSYPILDIENPESSLDLEQFFTKIRIGWKIKDRRVTSNDPRRQSFPTSIGLSHRLAYMIGLYIAEGHISSRTVVNWTFHEDEEPTLAAEVVSTLNDLFGLEASIYRHSDWGKVCRVICRSEFLADFLRSCGEGSLNKKIPDWAWNSSLSFLENILLGWLAGDGSEDNRSVSGDTVSLNLAWQMFFIAISTGRKASIKERIRRDGYIQGRKVRQRNIYTVSWQTEYDRPGSYRLEEAVLTRPIRKITTDNNYSGNLYNLEVEEDHSYVTESGAVHNCTPFGNHLLSGIIDNLLYDKSQDILLICDLKTGARPNKDNLHASLQFTSYDWATRKDEFWTGYPPEIDKYWGVSDGSERLEQFRDTKRLGVWFDLRNAKEYPVGQRTEQDFLRMLRLCDQIELAIERDVYVPTITGDTCKFCAYKDVCSVYVSSDLSGEEVEL